MPLATGARTGRALGRHRRLAAESARRREALDASSQIPMRPGHKELLVLLEAGSTRTPTSTPRPSGPSSEQAACVLGLESAGGVEVGAAAVAAPCAERRDHRGQPRGAE